jgi:hypothetical protein
LSISLSIGAAGGYVRLQPCEDRHLVAFDVDLDEVDVAFRKQAVASHEAQGAIVLQHRLGAA